MPFKIKLKKSRQYNVASKNILVISVQLLDNTNFECTLTSQSLGKECLGNLCQRLGLQQSDFFGLKFLSKHGSLWWVDLERPLKKQLDRHAQESHAPQLQLGIMFFVANVSLLQDEVTRYHYFLQLKTDIVEGHLKCNPKQAVLLAAYSLQAEFGAHDPERHTAEYLTNFAILPKSMTLNKESQEALMEQVILTHCNLQDLSPSLSEVYYITECQQLDGYGQQIFSTKDHSGAVLCIGASLGGVFVKPYHSGCHHSNIECFSWQEIVNLVHHRSYFGIECHDSNKSLQCHLEDVEAAKYVWKMCAQQHRFYNSQRFSKGGPNTRRSLNELGKPCIYSETTSDSSHRILASQESLDELGVYHTEQYNNDRRQKGIDPEDVYLNVMGSSQTLPSDRSSFGSRQPYSSHQQISHAQSQSNFSEQKTQFLPQIQADQGSYSKLPNEHRYSHQSINESEVLQSPVSNGSQGGLNYSASNLPFLEQSGVQECGREVALPMYRQAPDYETAVMHKYGLQSASLGDVSVTSSTHMPAGIVNNQQETNRAKTPQMYSHYKNYIDLSHIVSSASLAGNSAGNDHPDHNFGYSNLLMPPSQTYSTPELHLNSELSTEQLLSSLQLNAYHQYKSPPPYPFGSQRPCTSTPDLTHNLRAPNHHQDLSSRKQRASEPVPESYLGELPPQTVTQQISLVMSNFGRQAANLRSSLKLPANSSFRQQNDYSFYTDSQSPQSINSQTSLQTNPQSPPTPMGPMFVAAMNGLTLTQPDVISSVESSGSFSRDTRIQLLESQLMEGQFFIEFEQIPKRKPMADFRTALEADNLPRNRFKDVLPYEENRVCLTPNKENRTGYINASHISVSVGNSQRFYIAAQGPMTNTVQSFWQMVWEHHISLIVMLTETQEQGCEKCHPYWPQNDHSKITVNEFQVSRSFSVSSSTYVTCSLVLSHPPSRSQRSVWHIQYTDWPDHRCPQDLQGFLSFMEEIDAVRRLALNEQPPGRGRNAPVLVHCSAGVGRSGVVILCDIMLYSLDHANETLDLAKLLTQLRYQRMLTVQTLAQYKFVYSVLIQYLKNSRLI